MKLYPLYFNNDTFNGYNLIRFRANIVFLIFVNREIFFLLIIKNKLS